jgi:hypothetical protein
MFVNKELQQYLETSSSINSQSLVMAEWNMNIAENISTIGNYRYRPTSSPDSDDFFYSNALNVFDNNDCNNETKFWCGATDADVLIDGGLDNDNEPIAFVQPNEKERLLYSLEDCFKRFRPRSGINKLRFFEENYTHFENRDASKRPRYYMASRSDIFKYWTSYRKESGVERGIANKPLENVFYIEDAAPFVVYKDQIPANRIVVKMQSGVGDIDLGPFSNNGTEIEDPFYGLENQSTPSIWSIEKLVGNAWVEIISFNSTSTRSNGEPIVGSDGYVEVAYGLIIPEEYKNNINIVGAYPIQSLLPVNPPQNSAYYVGNVEEELGSVFVWTGSTYESFTPSYGWYVIEESDQESALVTKFVSPDYYTDSASNQTKYKEFEYVRGLRVVIKAMNKQNSTFDLLELSPRLSVDLSDRVSSFSINKSASDLGVSGMPVGQLLASNGSLSIFDFDDAFNSNNTNSILSSFKSNNMQVKLFEKISDFSDNVAKTYTVPIKTMYSDGFPESNVDTRKVSVSLRDLFFYLELNNVPDLLLENATLSQASSIILDNIGFSNYTFKRVDEEDDPVIPYFFVKPDTSVAEVLQDLALATQTAIFFDEENNLTFMSKNYIMPSKTDRETDLELLGSLDQGQSGIVENNLTRNKLSNISELSSTKNEVFNDGKIIFQEKYIEKSYGSLKEANYLNQDQNWIYKPALLWEVAGTPPLRSIESSTDSTSSYSLAAVPLNSDLSDQPPTVINNQLIGNVLDFGEGAYWVARYNGYFYANGEIIRYDAIEHNVSGIGNVWISSLTEYQNYFSKIQFGGKIYPTGRVRIYSEPFYEEVGGITVLQNGDVRKHGRAQFGTNLVYHNAGLSQYWSDTTINAPVGGVEMDSKYLFSTFPNRNLEGVYNQKPIPIDVQIDILEPSDMNDIAYADSKWVGVGSDGIFRTSTDGETWTTIVDNDFVEDYSFNTIAYGDGVWVAAGYSETDGNKSAAIATSTDAENWTEVYDLNLDSDEVTKVYYDDDLWVAVGAQGLIATSDDSETWTQQTSRLDYTVFGSNKPKILSATSQETNIKISRFKQEAPSNYGIVLRKNHGLKNNDQIELTTTGTLPTNLSTLTTYYVKEKNRDSFYLTTTEDGESAQIASVGSGTHSYKKKAATFTINTHNLVQNEAIRVIGVSTLPSGVSEETIYYARPIDKNRVHLSETADGALIPYSTPQSETSHKIERFVSSNLYSVYYGNGIWAVGGDSGVFATSADGEAWISYQTKLKGAKILHILYADNRWLISGSSGKTSTTTTPNDFDSWIEVKTRLNKEINSIAYGNSIWLAAGQGGKISRSTNLSQWKIVKDANFQNTTIKKLAYSSYWLAVGNRLKISKSTDDGLTWSDESQENVGELFFTTQVPHDLTPFDTVSLTATGSLSDSEPTLTTVAIGTPAVFTSIKHKLSTNDKVLISTTGNMPTGIEESVTYYAVKLSENTFGVSLSPSGTPLEASGTPTGQFSFTRKSAEADTRYFVTPKNITNRSFTLSETREDARLGITFKSKGYNTGSYKVEPYTVPDLLEVLNVSADSNGHVKVTTTEPNTISVGDRVFFGIQKNDKFVETRIPGGLTRYAPFYVHSVIDVNSFIVSDIYAGSPLAHNGTEFSLGSGEKLYAILNLTEEIIARTLLSPNTINFSVDNLLEISSGSGELVSPTRVSAIRSPAQIKKDFTISIASPAVLTSTDHGLFSLDIIKLVTTGTLPFGIDAGKNYMVEKINNNSFKLIDLITFKEVETRSGENPDAKIPGDLESGSVETTINYREQSGTHSFVKLFNDTNRVVLNKKVGSNIPQYEISQQEILIDQQDGETEERTYYNNVSSKNTITAIEELQITKNGKAGFSQSNKSLARLATRNGIIKNYFTRSSFSETDINKFLSTQTGTVQASALVFSGPSFEFESGTAAKNPLNFLSYAHKPLDNRFSHFGTRMRIIGRISQEDQEQIVENSLNYFLNPKAKLDEKTSIYGGSAGLGIMINPETNMGYYFEIIALSGSNVSEYTGGTEMFNLVFYKVVRKVSNDEEEETTDSSRAIPIKLWQGNTSIVADDGTLVGQFRTINDSNPSVYDVSIEYEDVDDNNRKFYLMINNRIVAIVEDTDPLPVHNNMALFVRGRTRAMFENIYALSNNYSQNTVFELDAPVNSVFGVEKIDVSQSFRKYAISGAIQNTYLSGIGSSDVPKYNIYYEEFGTIMRECSYFSIRYDKAYPALYAKISDTFNKMKGYTVSGFVPTAYGAEFLVFNNTDSVLNLDETSGNYLRIQGVTFTQSSDKELTVDDYFERVSSFSDPDIVEDGTIFSPVRARQSFLDIKNSRTTYGRKEFSISSPYIQSQDEANNLMGWIISKIMKERKSVGIKVFAMPIIQLGDIVSIDYTSNDSIEQISLSDNRFVVYNIEYSRDDSGPSMSVYLSEVV